MLSHRIEGHGPPLLLLHGFGVSFNIWNGLRPLLRDHFTLIEVELPGIGLSPVPPPARPYLAAAVDALDSLQTTLGVERWSILAYSTGTRVAEGYIQSRADRVERAVFLCPLIADSMRVNSLRSGIRMDARRPQVASWILSGWRFRFLINLLGFNLKSSPLAPEWFAEMSSQPMEILKTTLRSISEISDRPFVLPAEILLLFVWGREDWIIPAPRQVSARDVVIHAGHSMPQTRAREVAEIVVPFLNGTRIAKRAENTGVQSLTRRRQDAKI